MLSGARTSGTSTKVSHDGIVRAKAVVSGRGAYL